MQGHTDSSKKEVASFLTYKGAETLNTRYHLVSKKVKLTSRHCFPGSSRASLTISLYSTASRPMSVVAKSCRCCGYSLSATVRSSSSVTGLLMEGCSPPSAIVRYERMRDKLDDLRTSVFLSQFFLVTRISVLFPLRYLQFVDDAGFQRFCTSHPHLRKEKERPRHGVGGRGGV